MSDIIIRAENIGKRYTLSHLASGGRGGYQRFSESLAYWAKAPLRWMSRPISHLPSPISSTEDFWALKDINFEIKQGEVVGIIGRNGAGKSTLLKILSRITEPTTGRITLKGRVASLLEVGTGFHPELTGRENIYLNGAILGMRRDEIKSKFDEIVAFAEIERFLDTPVKRYSSGMYVRLAFAVAAHLEPEILIVDEVLAVGDAQFQAKCLGKMQDVASGGRTVLFVSHNMAAVRALCQRGVLLEKGHLKADGDVEDIIHRYVASGRETGGVVEWTDATLCPQDDVVRLWRVQTVADGEATGRVPTGRELNVLVDYEMMCAGYDMAVSVHLYSALGACVFATTNYPSVSATPDPWGMKEHPPGRYQSHLTLPANFLNEGHYSLHVYLVSGASHVRIARPDVLSFIAEDTGEMRAEYTGPWIGVIRPRLPWHTKRVSG